MQMVKRENAVNLPVYETIKHKVEIPECEIVIFTSPSNVDGYFENRKWQPNQIAIAMGEATESALIRKKVYKCTKPNSFDDVGMVQAVLGL